MGVLHKGFLKGMCWSAPHVQHHVAGQGRSKIEDGAIGSTADDPGQHGSGVMPWHQQQHIVSHIFSFLSSSKDVLQAELVCKAWRQIRATLPSELLLQHISSNHSSRSKALKRTLQQQAWLAANYDRASALCYQEQQEQPQEHHHSTSSSPTTVIKLSNIMAQHSKQQTAVCSKQYTAAMVALMCNAAAAKSLTFCSCPSLSELPSGLCSLQQLQSLTISCCNALRELPVDIGCMHSLQQLQLLHCGVLSALPSSIGELQRLQRLVVKGCPALQHLPDAVCALSGVEVLEVESCGLKSLPSTFPGAHMTSLKSLVLKDCVSLQELPDEFCQGLSGVQQLTLQLPNLQFLPADLGRISSLQKFTLGSNVLEQVPSSIGQLSRLSHLVILECASLAALPVTISNLGHLRRLDLGLCGDLNELPEGLGAGPVAGSLVTLVISNCDSFRGLPHSIGQLRRLEQLVLHNCPLLRHLPSALGELTNGPLKRVTISGCESLHALPMSMGPLLSKITPGRMAAAVAAETMAARDW